MKVALILGAVALAWLAVGYWFAFGIKWEPPWP